VKKGVWCGLMVVGLASVTASARVDPFAIVPVTPTPTVTSVSVSSVPVSGTSAMVVVTRPVVVAPARPPLISPIR